MFIYKHSEANEYVRNSQTSNLLLQLQLQLQLEILKIKKKKKIFRVLFLYENKHIWRFSNLNRCTFNPLMFMQVAKLEIS